MPMRPATKVRRLASWSLALALIVGGAAVAGAAASGDRAPDFTLRDTKGNTVKLSSLRGKVVVLDFWASWCGPCKKELPALAGLSKKWAQAGKPVAVVTVNIDKDRANAEKFLTTAKIAGAIQVL